MNFSGVRDTPGYFYAIGYALCAALVGGMQISGRQGRRRWLVLGLLAAFLVAFMTLTPGLAGAAFVASLLVIVSAIYGAMYAILRDGAQALFCSVKAFIYGELTASLCWQLCCYAGTRWGLLARRIELAGAMAAIYAATVAGLWLFERPLYRDGLQPRLTGRDLVTQLVTGLAVLVVSNLGYLERNGPFSGTYARDIFAIRTLVDVSGAMMIHAMHRQLIEAQLRIENEAMQNIVHMQYQAYQLSRQSMDVIDRKYHDLKHQIALLRAGTEPRAGAWLDRLERDIADHEADCRTGSPVLDVVLTQKLLYCRGKGIELKVIADGGLLAFMDDMDASALFGNMLDNAIEAVEALPEGANRVVRLYVGREKRFVRIRVENPCAGPVTFRDGLPVTTKRDERFHGFGVKSMRRTAEQYGGTLSAAQEGGRFVLRVLIPLPEAAEGDGRS